MDFNNFSFLDGWSDNNDFQNNVSSEEMIFNNFPNDVPSGFSNGWSVGNNFPNHDSNRRRISYEAQFTTDQVFESRNAMLEWVRRIGEENGFEIVIGHSTNMMGGKMPRCTLICAKGGTCKTQPEGHVKQRETSTNKCDCPFLLRCTGQRPNGVMWKFKVVNGFHNHDTAESLDGHEFTNRLTETHKEYVRDLSDSTAPREIFNILVKKFPSSTPNIRSIYNVIAMHKKEQLGGLPEMGYVLDQLNTKEYKYDYLTDECTNRVTDILWIHPTSLDLLVNFPSVLVIDATYNINEYKRQLLEIVGITSTFKTFSVMFAILHNEKKERFIWVLDTLKRWMVGRGAMLPSVIVSDRDLALVGVIEECFPFSQHILCIWHINQNVNKICKPMLGERFEEFKHQWQGVIRSSTMESLNLRWNAMRADFLEYNNAINYLWETWLRPYKERFVGVYVNKCMHLGSHSSQRVESAHAKLKRYFEDSSASLATSFQKIEKMLNRQFRDIRISFERSLNKRKHRLAHQDIFSQLICRISSKALDLMDGLWTKYRLTRNDNQLLDVGYNCNCKIKLTHGFPCAHDIAIYFTTGMPIPLNAIHIHWRTLSMKAPDCTDHGVQPDSATQLFERLNEMDPSTRESMINRLIDIVDPSHCTVLPPAYNTQQRGRPTRRDENIGRRPHFLVSTSEYEAPRQWKNRTDPFVRQFPEQYWRYITRCVDVQGDGHCGFRAIAAQLHGSENEWRQVRLNLMNEIQQNWEMYNNIYYEDHWAQVQLNKLNCFADIAPDYYWMDAISLGIVIASAYNVVLHTLVDEPRRCFTHLPLRPQQVPVAQRTHIAIGRVHGNHFVQVFLVNHCPIPPIIIWRRISLEPNDWAHDYQERIQLWYDVLGIDQPNRPQFGGDID